MTASISIWNNSVSWKATERNNRVSLAIQHTIEVQWSILKYTWDKTKEAYLWQNFLQDPRSNQLKYTYVYPVEILQ